MKLSVVLPTHNEEQNIERLVPALLEELNDQIAEIIIVNDGSTDRTDDVSLSLMREHKQVKLINRKPPCGVGRALKDGFSSVDGCADHVLMMDSDFIYNVKEIKNLIKKIEHGYDGVLGSRYMTGGSLIRYPLLKREALL